MPIFHIITSLKLGCIGLAKKFIRLMNMLFDKVLGENEKCLLFLLKTEETFWPTQYLPIKGILRL